MWVVMMERRETDEEGTGGPYKKTQILSHGDEGTLGWSYGKESGAGSSRGR